MMRPFYSSFPNGSAGLGLLLLRSLSGGGLADQSRRALASLLAAPESRNGTLVEIALVAALASSILIVIGLWTSVSASVAPAATLVLFGLGLAHFEVVLFASLSIVVALLGPGALSLDARLFGWRQIRFPPANKTGSRER
jgi:hypothetical protein